MNYKMVDTSTARFEEWLASYYNNDEDMIIMRLDDIDLKNEFLEYVYTL